MTAVNISLTLVNNVAPVLTANRSTVTYAEGSGSLSVGELAGIALSDGDDNVEFLMQNATVTLSGVLDSVERLTVSGSSDGISVRYGEYVTIPYFFD